MRITCARLVSCQVTNVGTESDAGPGLQGAATRHSGGYGEEAERSRAGFGAARMRRLLRDRALEHQGRVFPLRGDRVTGSSDLFPILSLQELSS